MESRIPRDLDWVKVRAMCSLSHVFEALKREVEEDVNKCNELRKDQGGKFSIYKTSNDFTVFWESNSLRESVIFFLKEHTIEVQTGDHAKKILEAGLTLNNAGECKFSVDGEELESWQLRKRVLEKFFFG